MDGFSWKSQKRMTLMKLRSISAGLLGQSRLLPYTYGFSWNHKKRKLVKIRSIFRRCLRTISTLALHLWMNSAGNHKKMKLVKIRSIFRRSLRTISTLAFHLWMDFSWKSQKRMKLMKLRSISAGLLGQSQLLLFTPGFSWK
jgi:hypothetical protein